ncbi:MAG TPA: hypothetical protein VHQ65_03705 [Thermoanaerobaculia bacterium]|nr:hypothetical protein [Thermoanaerobaculia bacterium]
MTTTPAIHTPPDRRSGTTFPTRGPRPALTLLAALLLAGCGSTRPPQPAPPPESAPATVEEAAIPAATAEEPAPPPEPEPVVVGELWETERRPTEGLDAVAVWPGAGDRAWLIATARATHRLVVFDAATGELLRELGAAGDGPAQFRGPGPVTVVDDLAFVAERGNARVQVLRLPGLAPLGFVGTDELEAPTGVAAVRLPGGGYEVLVTQVAAPEAGAVASGRRYRIGVREGHLEPIAFEGSGGPGLAVSAELPAGAELLPLTALYACPDGGGYRLMAEAGSDPTLFRLLDRATGEPIARFTGRRTASTSGLWLSQVPLPDLPAGALYAVHDGQSVTAFDWRDVAAATGVRADCLLEGK